MIKIDLIVKEDHDEQKKEIYEAFMGFMEKYESGKPADIALVVNDKKIPLAFEPQVSKTIDCHSKWTYRFSLFQIVIPE